MSQYKYEGIVMSLFSCGPKNSRGDKRTLSVRVITGLFGVPLIQYLSLPNLS